MASTSASAQVSDEDLANAEQLFEDGVELLNASDFVSASDCFAQCLETKVTKFGEHHPAVAPVYSKYAASLLGCARQQGDSLLGSLKTATANGSGSAVNVPKDASVEEDGSDLSLAWEMGELARLVMTGNKDAMGENVYTSLAEVHETLADIGAEREAFEDAIADFEQTLEYLDKAPAVDVRWQAEVHFKLSIPLELMDRVDDAAQHVNTAIAQLAYLLKQKQAQRQELNAAEAATASAGPPTEPATTNPDACNIVTPASDAPAPSSVDEVPPAAPKSVEPLAAKEADPPPAAKEEDGASTKAEGDESGQQTADAAENAGDGGEAEADDDDEEEEGEEETELEVVEREVKELQDVLKDLKERKKELASAKEQDKAVKAQLKAMLGGADVFATGAVAPQSENNAKATQNVAAVQDLGVIGGSKRRDEKSEAPQQGKSPKKRPLEEASENDNKDESASKVPRT